MLLPLTQISVSFGLTPVLHEHSNLEYPIAQVPSQQEAMILRLRS